MRRKEAEKKGEVKADRKVKERRYRDREKSPICLFTPHMLTITRLEQGEARNLNSVQVSQMVAGDTTTCVYICSFQDAHEQEVEIRSRGQLGPGELHVGYSFPKQHVNCFN